MAELKEWPEGLIPNNISVNLVHNAKVFSSPLNNSVVTHTFPGAMWKFTLSFGTLDNFNRDEIEQLQSFIWSLNGVDGRFLMWNFSKRGTPEKGSPVVSSNGQYGGILQTNGWQPNQLVIPRGSYFSVNNELKFITEDMWSDSVGNCALMFTPWLRKSPAIGDKITTNKPKSIFRLADNDQGVFDLTPGLEATTTIEIVEAFYV